MNIKGHIDFKDKLISEELITKTTFLKVFYEGNDGALKFDLVYADFDITADELKESTAKKYGISTEQVVLTYLFGIEDRAEMTICGTLTDYLPKTNPMPLVDIKQVYIPASN